MQKKITLKIKASATIDDAIIKEKLAQALGKKVESITGYYIQKKSLDARGKVIFFNLQVNAFIDEPPTTRPAAPIFFRELKADAKTAIIIGAGPAGLFAALKFIELGIKPIIIERGKDVRSRRRDLAKLNKEGVINPESNYCFGEGGAGTYSDGKLYTRSNKRGDINRILQLFVQFGAPENILYDAHPHIGTNKLPQIITAMRQLISDYGGEIHFDKKLIDFSTEKNQVTAIHTADGDKLKGDAYVLATGHSARDIFELLHRKNILIAAKPFALGVRVEHPQHLVDQLQYHCNTRPGSLPPAAYSLVQQVDDKGVFSFCMCPGGIIAPAATDNGELVVNGWSPSKRDNPFANSGMVVQVEKEDAFNYFKQNSGAENFMQPGDTSPDSPLLTMRFQQQVERNAFKAGGGQFVAPAQRMQDFVEGKLSATVSPNSYLPGLRSANLQEVLPPFIYKALASAFISFGKKMRTSSPALSYYTNEAIVVATESRTSSPVRIPRDAEGLFHPQLLNLYPCAEGAGYAGGIVSAAMDGERIAQTIANKINNL
jgi:uncharacterized protein